MEMTRLGKLDNDTIYSIRKLFSHLIKATFHHTCKTPCPRHLSNVRDLAFLPKLIGTELHWKEIRLDSLTELMQLSRDRFQVLTSNPQLLRIEQQECLTVGQNLVNYRLAVQQDLPTRLKHLYSWNLNSWSLPDPPSRDAKTRRCRRLLRTGPVCLQETKWDEGVPEKLAGYLPGTKVFSSTGTLLDSGKDQVGLRVEHLPTVQQACSIPKLLLQDLFDVIDTLKENASYVPNDEVSSQASALRSTATMGPYSTVKTSSV